MAESELKDMLSKILDDSGALDGSTWSVVGVVVSTCDGD